MATLPPSKIPFPLSSFPGANPQESSGRLINAYSEPLGEANRPTGPDIQVWRRAPGLSLHSITGQAGYRGGLLVNNTSYEVFTAGTGGGTVDANGVFTNFTGTLIAGSSTISIARNQAASPNIVVVDPQNGAFSIAGTLVTSYTGGGVLPQPNSVCFQDGYFFFTIGDNRVFASGINALTQNALTFIVVQSRADANLLRGIAYSGLLWLFTNAHCEIWSDTAQPFPAFPYSRLAVIDYGLIQQGAIAGWETGFAQLLWVAQDFGVYWAQSGQQLPTKVSPPDLEKLIEAQVRAGNTLTAYAYAFAGKKFWVLSSGVWTWEFNLVTQKWNERTSLVNGLYTRWRATSSHPAFGKFLVGDTQSGNLLFIDNSVYDENGSPQLYRIESGPVTGFPAEMRIARADFEFAFGTGIAVSNFPMVVSGAASGTGGVVRLTVGNTSRALTGDIVNVSGIVGTTEANGTHILRVVDQTHVELTDVTFVNAYVSGGTVVDMTSPANVQNPTVAISVSKDGGITWGNPLVRSLGMQAKTRRIRASVKNLGHAGPMGNRWRLDVTDPVYTALITGTQSSNPREVGA